VCCTPRISIYDDTVVVPKLKRHHWIRPVPA
jgi:hypothetical protein